jgi:4-hydroxybenzoyl-CoA thioesterase
MVEHATQVQIRWSDVDPAGIVFYPRFFEWYDLGCEALFASLGLPWPEAFPKYDIVGVPIVESGSKFLSPARYGDILTIRSKVVEPGARYELKPGESVLAWTYEKVAMPPHLAGRIEGRSTLARLGLTIHNTAPTIHPGFGYSRDGRPVGQSICLEITNANPHVTMEITPGSLKSCISQLILEKVTSSPKELYFRKGQFTPK